MIIHLCLIIKLINNSRRKKFTKIKLIQLIVFYSKQIEIINGKYRIIFFLFEVTI